MFSKNMELNMFIRWLVEEGLDKEQHEELYDRALTRLYEAAKIAEGAQWNPPTIGLNAGLGVLLDLIDKQF